MTIILKAQRWFPSHCQLTFLMDVTRLTLKTALSIFTNLKIILRILWNNNFVLMVQPLNYHLHLVVCIFWHPTEWNLQNTHKVVFQRTSVILATASNNIIWLQIPAVETVAFLWGNHPWRSFQIWYIRSIWLIIWKAE